jgi:hypothetical protein
VRDTVRGDLRTPTGRNFVDVSVALGCREHLDAIAMFRFRRKRAFTHDWAMSQKKKQVWRHGLEGYVPGLFVEE